MYMGIVPTRQVSSSAPRQATAFSGFSMGETP